VSSSSPRGEAVRDDRTSYWLASTEAPSYGNLNGTAKADVVVVGGGIVGLTAALRLADAGQDVLVVEGDRIAAGVSGFTTAKLTAGHGLAYSHLEDAFGKEVAGLYAESQAAALRFVVELCGDRGIECDLERRTNVLYAESDADLKLLEAEEEAAVRAGLDVELRDDSALPFPIAGALCLPQQAQFHVRRYLLAVAAVLAQSGGRIVENSRVTEIDRPGSYEVHAVGGTAVAPTVIVASHYPLVAQGFFATRIHSRRSYVVAGSVEGDLDGMYINVSEPTRSLRTVPLEDGGRLLLVGGEGHRVGQESDTAGRYATLERFMHDSFAAGETLYRWSTQDAFTLDGLPFVGPVDGSDGLYVATGFGGWGMTNGTMAGLLLADAAQGIGSPWDEVYALGRRSLLASAGRFVKENTNVALQQAAGRLRSSGSLAEVGPGEAAVVSQDGNDVAVHRSSDGMLSAVSAACTHMGCVVAWNGAESSWDCPCHGSRFATDGRVLHGPATKPLKPVDLTSRSEDT
jgi:glycine/D-amino acid oxidase-like deaminating enzyme/nitrite reductase/ring-hydroxylating ferredoxin subunit